MKKLVFLVAIVVFVLFTFNSCDLPEKVKEQYGIDQKDPNGQNQNKTGHGNGGNGDGDDDDEESGQ